MKGRQVKDIGVDKRYSSMDADYKRTNNINDVQEQTCSNILT